MSMRIGVVVATHPEDYSVDLVMTDDGSRIAGVQVLTAGGSSRTGHVDLPAVPEKADKWDITKRTGQDMKAVIAYASGQPIVVGFLYPQINQMLMEDPKMRLDRHQSDVIQSIDGNGNIEIQHPNGLYIRIGETPDKTDLAGANADANLAVDRNTDREVHVRIEQAGGTAQLTITPQGEFTLNLDKSFNLNCVENINLACDGNFDLNAAGTVTINSGGTTDIVSGGNMTATAPRIDLNS